MKRILTALLALVMFFGLFGCQEVIDIGLDVLEEIATSTYSPVSEENNVTDAPIATDALDSISETPATAPIQTAETEAKLDENGWYYNAEDVSLYINTYGCLPSNFITKDEARTLGWEGGSVEDYAEGYAIGGDRFGNYEGLLPKASGRTYYECDIDTNGADSRGAKRIVFSNDGLIYYTDNHYESFILLYGEE